jgi:hypothetical protein
MMGGVVDAWGRACGNGEMMEIAAAKQCRLMEVIEEELRGFEVRGFKVGLEMGKSEGKRGVGL